MENSRVRKDTSNMFLFFCLFFFQKCVSKNKRNERRETQRRNIGLNVERCLVAVKPNDFARSSSDVIEKRKTNKQIFLCSFPYTAIALWTLYIYSFGNYIFFSFPSLLVFFLLYFPALFLGLLCKHAAALLSFPFRHFSYITSFLLYPIPLCLCCLSVCQYNLYGLKTKPKENDGNKIEKMFHSTTF